MPSSDIDTQLHQAKEHCLKTGHRLTAARARVLRILLEASQPLSAYDLLAQYQARHTKGAQPMTIYRALHFLQQQSLVHYLSSRRQYVSCGLPHAHARNALTQLLLCENCGQTQEVPLPGPLSEALQQSFHRHAFTLQQSELEFHGLCAHCQPSKECAHA
ncbi:MAG: transcriptional repressor [Hydrogenovibrio sp.]|uniref:Fur family transcriptional regulator n=1 Tax=Hydrogenovibrio sp. TaxID=2065821 RepID=UPI0028707B6B|nr:transcriptional repressor [Hydrogenovibrio sp.]MDR9498768.1 transcriptional repressor [Hydrogenovibrio sp.]